jgi:hypothetical protein
MAISHERLDRYGLTDRAYSAFGDFAATCQIMD